MPRLVLPREVAGAARFLDGMPDISGLPCDRITSAEVGDYMRRYHLLFSKARGVRLHHILASDPGTDPHDHPWDFVSVMLAGSYVEITPAGRVRYEAPCVIRRKAEDLHRLVLAEGDVWTYVVCGRLRRRWGFMTGDGWVPHQAHGGASIAGCDESKYTRW